jgi:Zn-finger nucleic acid-binding protein
MKCPACERELTELSTGGVRLDVCHGGCGGMWFEKIELEKLNDSDESDCGPLINVPVDTSIEIDDAQPRRCPKCQGKPTMRQHFVGGEEEGVRIDTCETCEGTWLDNGELEWIQSH